ncbi:nitroreductase [Salinibacterium sp. CAN_S4]|uniref:nitroreductase family protein n=1 Tax=Salinibacterium sp. CAN_S4 TaxID=2787727 RepID=UPI0018F03AA9
MSISLSDRRAVTTHPIAEVLAERWSPRSFNPSAQIDDAQLSVLLEAARWAPSASNLQPVRFIAARRGTAEFDAIVATLVGFNQVWAVRASALVVGIAVTAGQDGTPHRWAEYDLGQAIAHLSVQAHTDGLHVHQIGGFDPRAIADHFGLADTFVPVSITAIGTLGEAAALGEPYLSREVASRERLPLDDLVLVLA